MLRRSALVFAAVLLAVGLASPAFSAETGGKLDDCIFIDIGDVIADPGEQITVPVHLSDVTGWGVMAFELEICWCELPAGLLQYVTCEAGPVLENATGWSPPACGPCGPNCISVAAAGVLPLEGSGVLLNLIFHISANAKPCMCCDVWFESVNLYDPEDPLNVCESDGEVCIDWCDVSGEVMAWYCAYDDCNNLYRTTPLPDVRVHLYQCDESIATTYTDRQGRFLFECLPPLDIPGGKQEECPYCVDIDFCAVPSGLITAFDAAIVLRHLVCLDDLMCCPIFQCGEYVYPQMVAADVNCTDVITAYDASLILQYVVGLLPAFPCPDMWSWYFALCRPCEHYCPAGFGITGVLKGDVSGFCYGGKPMLAGATPEMELGIPRHFGDYVDVPINVKHADEVYSAQFRVDYNSRDFAVIGVEAAGPASSFLTAYNAEGGKLLVAMASSSSFSGSGDIAVVRLMKKHTPIPSASTRMEMASALLNETAPVINGKPRDAEIVRFGLGPVCPNPFAEEAVISFSAPAGARVSIGIYDVNGRLIRDLHSGQVVSGTQRAVWDGRDDAGARVARGVYFCRMDAGEFSATEKVVLLK